mgnify:CR=1 FL=1
MVSAKDLQSLSVDKLRNAITKFNKSITLTGYKTMKKSELIQAIVAMDHDGLNKELNKAIPVSTPVVKVAKVSKKEEPKQMPEKVAVEKKKINFKVSKKEEPQEEKLKNLKNLPKTSDAVRKLGSKAIKNLGLKLNIKMTGTDEVIIERIIKNMNFFKLFKN